MIRDFIKQINVKLKELEGVESRYKESSLRDNYIVFDVDVYDSIDGKTLGQVIIDVRYSDIMKLLEVQDRIEVLLDRWVYISEDTFGYIQSPIINDMSKRMDKQYWHEMRFDFRLRRNG